MTPYEVTVRPRGAADYAFYIAGKFIHTFDSATEANAARIVIGRIWATDPNDALEKARSKLNQIMLTKVLPGRRRLPDFI